LGGEFTKLDDAPPNPVIVAQLEARLNLAMLDLIPPDTVDSRFLDDLKENAIEKIAAINGTDDLDNALDAANHLAFTAYWETTPPRFIDDEAQWLALVGDGTDPARIFGRFMLWTRDVDLPSWQDASRATTLLASAVAASTGLTFGSGAAASVAAAGAIITTVVTSTIWYLRARLQPQIDALPSHQTPQCRTEA